MPNLLQFREIIVVKTKRVYSIYFTTYVDIKAFIFCKKIISLVACPSLILLLKNPGMRQISYNKKPMKQGKGLSLRYFFPVGTVASFLCKSGYILSQPSSSTCDISGNWTPKPPRCSKGNEIKYFQTNH